MSKIGTPTNKEKASAQGRRAFEENMRRGYNPYKETDQELASIWWNAWDAAKKERDQAAKAQVNRARMRRVRRVLYRPVLLAYRYLHAPLMDAMERYKHRNDPPLPPVPCQICGKPGHKERYCPNATGLGY